MTRLACDRSWEAEAIEDGRSGPNERAAFERHAASCNVCAEAIGEQRSLRNLMQALPEFEAEPFADRRARARLLQRANAELTRQHRRYPAWLIATATGLALAGVASAAIWSGPRNASDARPSNTQSDASSSKHAGATHVPRLHAPIESAQLAQGRSGNPPAPAVAEPTATLSEPTLAAPAVAEPTPTLSEPTLAAPTMASQARSAANALPSSPSATLVQRKASADRPTSPLASASSGSAPADDFAQAVSAFQRGSYSEADGLFAAFKRRHPRDARGEDAAFLRAVARSRAGDAAGAAALASEYLRAFPGGLRRTEAERLQRALGKKKTERGFL